MDADLHQTRSRYLRAVGWAHCVDQKEETDQKLVHKADTFSEGEAAIAVQLYLNPKQQLFKYIDMLSFVSWEPGSNTLVPRLTCSAR